MPNLEARVKRLEERTTASERGPLVGLACSYYFDEIINSRNDLKDGELLGVRVDCEPQNKHYPRLPGETEEECFARVKAKYGGKIMVPIRTMEYEGKLVVIGTLTVKLQPLDQRESGQMKRDGFVILQLNPRNRFTVLDGKPHFAPLTEKEKEMAAVGERLRQEFLTHPERSREEKNEKAKRLGFRVIYPDSPDSEALWQARAT